MRYLERGGYLAGPVGGKAAPDRGAGAAPDPERDHRCVLLTAQVAQQHLDPHLGRAPYSGKLGKRPHLFDVDAVDGPHVDLAKNPAEVPPAAGAVSVEGRGAPVGEVGAAPQRRDLDHEVVGAALEVLEVHLEREVAAEAADQLAVQVDEGAVVVALEAHFPAHLAL